MLSPQLVDEPVERHHPPRVDQEQRENGALPVRAEIDRTAIFDHLERPEDPELHHAPTCAQSATGYRLRQPRPGAVHHRSGAHSARPSGWDEAAQVQRVVHSNRTRRSLWSSLHASQRHDRGGPSGSEDPLLRGDGQLAGDQRSDRVSEDGDLVLGVVVVHRRTNQVATGPLRKVELRVLTQRHARVDPLSCECGAH